MPTETSDPAPLPDLRPTPLDTHWTFVTVLQYGYNVPGEWHEVVGDDEIVIRYASLDATITLREHQLELAEFKSLEQLGRFMEPSPFHDWSERILSEEFAIDDRAYYLSYSGIRLGEPGVATVKWVMWGDLLIEIAIEADSEAWSNDPSLRNTAALIAESFVPPRDLAQMTPGTVKRELEARFSDRPSGMYTSGYGVHRATELSCKQVFHDLLSDPVFIGTGLWQAYAVGETGAQVWHVVEPSLTIYPAVHNVSKC